MAKTNTAIALVKPAAIDAETLFAPGIEGDARANQIVDRASFDAAIDVLGASIADGQQSRTKAALLFNQACRLGIAHVAEKPQGGDDAEKTYMRLGVAHNAKGKGDAAFEAMSLDPKAAKSAISLLRSFGREAVLNQGEEFHSLVCLVVSDLGNECKLSPYMAMARANTRVCEAQKKQIGRHTFIATYDDIASWLKAKPAEKDTADVAMDKFLKGMTELSQEHSFGPDVESAMRLLLDMGNQFISDYTQAHSL